MNGIFNEIKNSWNRPNNGLMQLIIVNVAVFIAVILTKVVMTLAGYHQVYVEMMSYLMLPADIHTFIYRPWTIFTYFFLHEAPLHLLINMFVLYWFGSILLQFKGQGKLITLYSLGGVVGGLFYLLLFNTLPFFSEQVALSQMLGASGGVFAVVVGAATLVPNYRVNLFLLGEVRLKFIALVYVLFSLADTTGANAGGNIAHIGGALAGFIYVLSLRNHNGDISDIFSGVRGWWNSLFTKPSKIKVTHKAEFQTKYRYNNKPNVGVDVDQAVIDSILDKISANGYESLTKEEKEKLFNASKK